MVHALAARLADVPAIVRWLADVVSGASARQMQALASGAPGGLVLHGLDSLAPLEEPGWTVAAYRALPVSRPRREPVGPACSTVVDGVIALDRWAGPATA